MASPHSVESEEAAIACCLIDQDVYDDIAQLISPEDFFIEKNRIIFLAIAELKSAGHDADEISVIESLRSEGNDQFIGGIERLYAIMDRVETSIQWKTFAETIKEKSRLRQLARMFREGIEAVSSQVESKDVCAQIESSIIDMHKDVHEDDTIADAVLDVQNDLKSMLAGTYERHGLRTGVVNIDQQMLDGLENGTVTVVSAPTSCGKSQLALNIVGLNSVTNGLPSGYFSYEMLSKQLSKRMLQTFSGVNLGKFRDQNADAVEQQRVAKTAEKLGNTTILTNYSNRSADSMASLARQWKRKHGIRLLVVDYLQLMDPPSSKTSTVESISYNMKRVKALALDLDIPIIILSQVNREAIKKLELNPDRGLLTHDLIGGSAIECDADNIIIFWPIKGDPDESRTRGDNGHSYIHLKGQVAKQREGTRGVRFEMAFIEDIGRFR